MAHSVRDWYAMAPLSKGPRLYRDPQRGTYTIRDGNHSVRTGTSDAAEAERLLASYIGQKHAPEPGRERDPQIAEVIAVYAKEVAPRCARPMSVKSELMALLDYWGDRRVSDITSRACRGFKSGRGRRDLETLRAAVRYWHKEYGPLTSVPVVTLPPKPAPRERWLTRSEAARLLWASRRTEHLKRFVLLGLSTGTRAGALFGLKWSWIENGVMRRRAPGEREKRNKRTPPVRLSKRLQAFLRRWHAKDGSPADGFVVHVDGRPLTHVRRAWASALADAKLGRDVIPHTMRHSRATWLMQRGVPIWEASAALGMTPTMLQEVYGHHHPDFQKEAAEI
jgi:integrase